MPILAVALVLLFAASQCGSSSADLSFKHCPFVAHSPGVGWYCCPKYTVSWEGGAVVGVRPHVTASCRSVLADLAIVDRVPETSVRSSAGHSPFSGLVHTWWFWFAVALVSFLVVFPVCYLFLTRRFCALQNAELYNVRQVDDSPVGQHDSLATLSDQFAVLRSMLCVDFYLCLEHFNFCFLR